MRGMILVVLMAAALSSGCVSQIGGTLLHNNAVDNRLLAIRLAATESGGKAQVGVNFPVGVNAAEVTKGWAAAWKANPGTMGTATLVEGVLWTVLGLTIYDNMKSDNEDVITEERPTTSQTSGGDAVVVYGDSNEIVINKAAE